MSRSLASQTSGPVANGASLARKVRLAAVLGIASLPVHAALTVIERTVAVQRAGGAYFWITYLPKVLGGGTFYLTGLRDNKGAFLNGTDTYRLRVPADTPAKDFWSVIVYSMKSKGLESNWVPTGEDFFLLFRLYGPDQPLFDKTWRLGDVEKVRQASTSQVT